MTELLITLAILLFLALLRFGVEAEYGAGGLRVAVCIGFLKFRAYPKKAKRKRKVDKKALAARKAKKAKKEKKEPEEKKPGFAGGFQEIIQTAKKIFGRLRRKLLIKRLVIYYTAAGADPVNTALAFGGSNAAIGMIMPVLENSFKIRRRDIRASADFDLKEPVIYANALVSIAVWEAIYIVFAIIPFLLKSSNNVAPPAERKDGNINGKTPDKRANGNDHAKGQGAG